MGVTRGRNIARDRVTKERRSVGVIGRNQRSWGQRRDLDRLDLSWQRKVAPREIGTVCMIFSGQFRLEPSEELLVG